jgi:integrase
MSKSINMKKKIRRTECSGMEWNEFNLLINNLKQDKEFKFLLFISIGVYCGLRCSDILRLRWFDVIGKSEVMIVEKKTGKTRSISLNANLLEIINLCHENIQTKGRNGSLAYIFSNRIGMPFSIQYANRQLHKLFSKYNIKTTLNNSSHVLKKTFGKFVYEKFNKSESALILLSQIFNHSSVSITRRYIGIEREQIQNVYLSL